MRKRDAIKQGHEKAVADQLFEVLRLNATYERNGDPNKNEPDVIYRVGGKTVGIEVATAYYEDTDARDAWEIAAGERPLAPGEIRPRAGSLLRNPDEMICARIQAELDDKCSKVYAGTDETWLCINQEAALSDAASVAECLKSLRVPTQRHFARIYLTYHAPLHDRTGYTVEKIL